MKNRRSKQVKTSLRPVKTSIQPKIAELQGMIHSIERREPVRPLVQPNVPWYNPELHTTGDMVRMKDAFGHVEVVTL